MAANDAAGLVTCSHEWQVGECGIDPRQIPRAAGVGRPLGPDVMFKSECARCGTGETNGGLVVTMAIHFDRSLMTLHWSVILNWTVLPSGL